MELDNIMRIAIAEREMSEGSNDSDSRKMRTSAYKRIRDDINPIRDEIGKLVKDRLCYDDADKN